MEVKLSFTGCVTVEADSFHEAVRIVQNNFRAMLDKCETNNCPAIIDWDVDKHSSVTVAR